MTATVRRAIVIAAATLWIPCSARSQSAPAPRFESWTFSATLGGFARGNKDAIMGWLRRNAYGVPEPERCGFDMFFRKTCSAPASYPHASGAKLIGAVFGARGNVTERWSAEFLFATEQSGTATGRCDDLALQRDARCTQRFMDIEFEGASFASLAVLAKGRFHLGAGPALMFANWRMYPGHVPGLWFDATYGRESSPLFARAQFRVYETANFPPERGFSGFHPSTLIIGIGFAGSVGEPMR